MVKKIRFQENRKPRRRDRGRTAFVFEPIDGALLAVVLAVLAWLQWLVQVPHV